MSLDNGGNLVNLNPCGCCQGLELETPRAIFNEPGLSLITYRVGNQAQFKASLVARLSMSQFPQLQPLTTRDTDDFTIALLDAWATVADVLTFYQERIANEAYLRTARERLSLLYLGRLIGYELRPGVAAHTYLAFTLEDTPTAPPQVTLDRGLKVKSVPGPKEESQTYETIDKLEARPVWNSLKPRLSQPQPLLNAEKASDELWLKGITTGLQPGDVLLIFPDDESSPLLRTLAQVTPEAEQQRTKLKLQPLSQVNATQTQTLETISKDNPILSALESPLYVNQTIGEADLQALGNIQGFTVEGLFKNIVATEPAPGKVIAFRVKTAIFGHNAPKWDNLPYVQRVGELVYQNSSNPPTQTVVDGIYYDRQDSWVDTTLDNYHDELSDSATLYLDSVYPKIIKDSWIVLKDNLSEQWKMAQVSAVKELTKSDFTLTAKVTRLTLTNDDQFDQFSIRSTTVFAQSEELELAPLPVETTVSGQEIDLNGLIEGLSKEKMLLIEGELQEKRGNYQGEVLIIEDVKHHIEAETFYTTLTLKQPLTHEYVRETVTIYGNIARATHGDSKTEVLGSGNASQPYQTFTLSFAPLTYISSTNPSGAESTLQVRVNNILWHEVASLFGKSPLERVFITRRDDQGQTTLQFGDGKTGSRLPTGQENVTASYRQGIGLAGLVKAKQLTLPLTRPLGLKGVTNPLPALNAQDPESREEARRNAPLTVLTLERLVSLQDYEDFARSFAGIAKALATWFWNGQKRSILVTIAGYQGQEIPDDSQTYLNLLEAMAQAGDPFAVFTLKSYQRQLFHLDAGIQVDGDYLPDRVLSEVRQTLLSHFSFESRNLGQSVTKSEAIALMQSVPGVVSVDLNLLYLVGETPLLQKRLIAKIPPVGTRRTAKGAELIFLNPEQLKLQAILLRERKQ